MIHLSVAVGRFVETLIWAILRVAGVVTIWVLIGLAAAALTAVIARRWWRAR